MPINLLFPSSPFWRVAAIHCLQLQQNLWDWLAIGSVKLITLPLQQAHFIYIDERERVRYSRE